MHGTIRSDSLLGEIVGGGTANFRDLNLGGNIQFGRAPTHLGGWDLGEMARKGKLGGEGLDWGV